MFIEAAFKTPSNIVVEVVEYWNSVSKEITIDTNWDMFCNIGNVPKLQRKDWSDNGGWYVFMSLYWTERALPVGINAGSSIAYDTFRSVSDVTVDKLWRIVRHTAEITAHYYKDILRQYISDPTKIATMELADVVTYKSSPSIVDALHGEHAVICMDVINYIKRFTKVADNCTKRYSYALQHSITLLNKAELSKQWECYAGMLDWSTIEPRVRGLYKVNERDYSAFKRYYCHMYNVNKWTFKRPKDKK